MTKAEEMRKHVRDSEVRNRRAEEERQKAERKKLASEVLEAGRRLPSLLEETLAAIEKAAKAGNTEWEVQVHHYRGGIVDRLRNALKAHGFEVDWATFVELERNYEGPDYGDFYSFKVLWR